MISPGWFAARRQTILILIFLGCSLLTYHGVLGSGFLGDDYLDMHHRLSDEPLFNSGGGGGYRPLIVAIWAADNLVYGPQHAWGWHLTNLLFFVADAMLVFFLIRKLGIGRWGRLLGTGLFLLSWAAAPSVARVSGRTTLIALLPLLASFILHLKWVRSGGWKLLMLGQFMFLVSLFSKETALACPPVFLVLALFPGKARNRRAALVSLAAATVTLGVYLTLRISTVGTSLSYQQSATFSVSSITNMITLAAMPWKPWLTGIPVRVLLPSSLLLILLLPVRREHKILFLVLTVCLLLPVASLGPRGYLASSALVPAALMFGAAVDGLGRRSAAVIALPVLLGGFLAARDEVRIIGDASDLVAQTTDAIAGILEEIPGNGPVYFQGIDYEYAGYQTLWPGELLVPLECRGFNPGRYVGDAVDFWWTLYPAWAEDPGVEAHFADLSTGRVLEFLPGEWFDPGRPDTTFLAEGPLPIQMLRSCTGCVTEAYVQLRLTDPFGGDMVVIEPESTGSGYYFQLGDTPAWILAGDGPVFFSNPVTVTFTADMGPFQELEQVSGRKAQGRF